MVDRIPSLLRDIFVPTSQVKAQSLGFQKGDKITAFVQSASESSATLVVDGREISARTQMPVQPGQWLELEVTSVESGTVVMRTLNRLAEEHDLVERQMLPREEVATESARLAQNFMRLLSAEGKTALTNQLTAFLSKLQSLPENAALLLSQFQQESAPGAQASNMPALVESLTEFLNYVGVEEGTASQIQEKLAAFFSQYGNEQTRNVIFKTFLTQHLFAQAAESAPASAAQSLNSFLLGLQVHNSLVHLSQTTPFFFFIPVVFENVFYPLRVYYFKEKQLRGKTPREKKHIILFVNTPGLGTLKIHLIHYAKKLSVIVTSAMTRIKTYLQPHLGDLQATLEALGYTVEQMDVRVERNLKETFSLGKELKKLLSLKTVNIQA